MEIEIKYIYKFMQFLLFLGGYIYLYIPPKISYKEVRFKEKPRSLIAKLQGLFL